MNGKIQDKIKQHEVVVLENQTLQKQFTALKKEHKALEAELKRRKPAKESPVEVAKPPVPSEVKEDQPPAVEKRDAQSQTDAISYAIGGTQPTVDHHDGIEIDQQTDTTQI
jgi:hypothetical protein